MRPAIILSNGVAGLGTIRSLGIMGVPVVAMYYDDRDTAYVSKYVRRKVRVPHPHRSEDDFVAILVNYAREHGAGLLIPTTDETVEAVSRNKGLLEQHYVVACSEWLITQKFLKKERTYALAEQLGIAAPKTTLLRSMQDIEESQQVFQYPCILKPCESPRYFELFGTKLAKVNDLDELVAAYRAASAVGVEVMLQELIPGDDAHGANYNSYFHNGEPIAEFTAKKVRLDPPQFGFPRVVVSKEIPEVIEPGRKLLQAMGFSGYSCTEFKKDARDGSYKLMEVNGRFNMSVLLALRCGINFPWILYRHLVEDKIESVANYQTNVYWIDLNDVIHALKYRDRETYSFAHYVRPYLRPHVFSDFDLKDPIPFLKRVLARLWAFDG